MRIVHIISGLGTGGAEMMLYRLVNELHAHQHFVVSLTSNGTLGRKLSAVGCDVYVLNFRGFLGFVSFFRLWALLRRVRPDVVQTWMYHADLVGAIVGRLAGINCVIWNLRNTKIPQGRFSPTYFVINFCKFISNSLPHKIVCCANSVLDEHARIGYSRSKLIVIPNGYQIGEFEPADKKKRIELRHFLDIPQNTKVVGIVGRYDVLKGYDIFVRAAGLLTNKHSDRLLFLAVGRNVDEHNTELIGLIRKFAPDARFILLGERDNISELMQVMDIFCLASRAEGFPNVVAEAMLVKVPCVVTDVGDARYIVGSTGMVVNPEDPLALADALDSMLSIDESARRELGVAARCRIEQHFGIASIAAQYESLYLSLENS